MPTHTTTFKRPENATIVIFGASGDLTKRKLIPSLFDLYVQHLMPEQFAVIGVGRTKLENEAFRVSLTEGINSFANLKNNPEEKKKEFLSFVSYIALDTKNQDDYLLLASEIKTIQDTTSVGHNCLFYMATPPSMYEIIAHHLAAYNLNNQSNGWKRLIIEKPFGYDLASAKELNKKLLIHYTEDQLYRIDHYLGKETVQNVLVTRFSNGFFEPLWNRNFVHHVEITAAESIGIENRGGYYDGAGALRDMVQNHLMQLVGLVAMEPPSLFNSESLRNEMVKVFEAIRPYKKKEVATHVVRGQYTESTIGVGYKQEQGVPQTSTTETFLAMKFYIDNWRWGGVPFYIRTGKRLPSRVTEIVIHLKSTPHQLFKNRCISKSCNQLIMRIQPDEGILLDFAMKIPGAGYKVQNVQMDFHYEDMTETYIPSAYERLLLDSLLGDSTLYSRGDAVEKTWEIMTPILDAMENDPTFKLCDYPAGSWGPTEANDLLDDKALKWRNPCRDGSSGDFCAL